MRRDIASRKAPEADAVDLGPDNIFAQMGEPDADERHLKSTLVTRSRNWSAEELRDLVPSV
jgi:hypothetical protein